MTLIKNWPLFAILFSSVLSLTPAHAQQWYKGNLHTHSYWSDGDAFPETVMDWYKTHGYDFIALSDHNTIAEGEKWKKISEQDLYQQAFEQYLQQYGDAWVNYRRDSTGLHVRLKPLSEFRPRFEEAEEFLIFQAQEVTTYLGKKAVHMGAVNVNSYIEPREGNTIVELIQRNLDAIREHGKASGEPVLQHLNHPNFTYSIRADDMIQLEGERFFEVFNGHPYVNNYGNDSIPGTETLWDQVNMAYLEAGKPLLLGLATDDSHHYHKFGAKFSNAGRGWVMVQADSLDRSALIHALQAGNFYASTGVTLVELQQTSGQISLEVDAEEGVNYVIEFIAARKGELETSVVHRVEGTVASYSFQEDDLFVRARVRSDKLKHNPYQEGDVELAWTQPVIHEN